MIWDRFGNVPNYVEPCAGSLGVLRRRPYLPPGTETVCDADGLLCNFWRAVVADADAVARHADWPVVESDLHARHLWLVGHREELTQRLEADPDYFDPRAAGWWVWGASIWIGSGWCTGEGPWVVGPEGVLVKRDRKNREEPGVIRQMPDVGSSGKGVAKQVPYLKSASQGGVQAEALRGAGVQRKMPDVSTGGKGVHRAGFADADPEVDISVGLRSYLRDLQNRFRRVRVVCGDWSRVVGPAVTTCHGLTGVLLDPPYADDAHSIGYAGGGQIWRDVVEWCQQNWHDPLLRIALCGYDNGDVDLPGGEIYRWKTGGGYGNQGEGRGRENAGKETIWFSPACGSQQPGLMGMFE